METIAARKTELGAEIPYKFDPNYISSTDEPEYQTEGSVGMDLPADLQREATLDPNGRMLIPTGLKVALPPGTEAQVRPRSGLALDHGLTVLNTPGTIDQDYRGDIGVILVNLSNVTARVEPGERIAQIVFSPVLKANMQRTDSLPDPEETHEGFGSTGSA